MYQHFSTFLALICLYSQLGLIYFRMKYCLTLLMLSILVTMSVHAQKRALKNRFNAGIVMGLTTSQINGDRYSGYDKLGGFAGLRVTARINTKSDLVVEMQYNRKGSRNPKQFVPGAISTRFIALDYIEVPILYHQRVETEIGLISLEGGIAYARLFGFKINEIVNTTSYSTFSEIQEAFNKNELALIMGGGVFINEHLRVMGRFGLSMTLLYKNENPTIASPNTIPEINHLRNLYLTFGVNYVF